MATHPSFDSAKTINPLLAYFNQQVNDYLQSPMPGADMEIIRCLEMLATSLGVSSRLLGEVGQHLSDIWRENACEDLAAVCHLKRPADSKHCSVQASSNALVFLELPQFSALPDWLRTTAMNQGIRKISKVAGE